MIETIYNDYLDVKINFHAGSLISIYDKINCEELQYQPKKILGMAKIL